MGNGAGDPQGGNHTAVELGLKGRFIGIDLDLRTEVGGPHGWAFAGRAQVNRSLRELVSALQKAVSGGDGGEDWFDEAALPDARLRSLSLTYVAEPPLFGIASDIDIPLGADLKLTFAFMRMSGSRSAGTDGEAR